MSNLKDTIRDTLYSAPYDIDVQATLVEVAVREWFRDHGEAFVRAHPNASAGALLRHLALLGEASATPTRHHDARRADGRYVGPASECPHGCESFADCRGEASDEYPPQCGADNVEGIA